jgi:hypothetical protein
MARQILSDESQAAAMRFYRESLDILQAGQWRGREEAAAWAEVATLNRRRVIRDLIAAGANIEDATGATIGLRGRI